MARPIRTCIICKKKDLKENLMRFSFKGNKLSLDPKKIVGRGFYVHPEHKVTEENLLEIWQRKKK
jgi:predicted RNA-binding protein YlxR (DUF448 family)